jgi:hypothetical protein
MSWPENKPHDGKNSQRHPGHPGQYIESGPGDVSQSQVPNHQPWRPWPPIVAYPPFRVPPQFLGAPVGAPYAYPSQFMGYGTPGMMQQWQGWDNAPVVAPVGRFDATGSMPRPPAAPAPSSVSDQERHQQYRPRSTHAIPDVACRPEHEKRSKEVLQEQQKAMDENMRKPPMGLEALRKIREWASSLVGREWELFWNDDNDNQEAKPGGKSADDNEGNAVNVIDDWYDGCILSVDVKDDGTVLGRAVFVGDETEYEMELVPSKVRPSARGWIKRTYGLLSQKNSFPPDTAFPEDHRYLQSMEEELSREYQPLSLPSKPNVRAPTVEELKDILSLRKRLKSQIYLRSKLASIVNLHGSVKFVGGERNPTEALANHLVECCNDLDRACEWYLRCWELLAECFGQKSGQRSKETQVHRERSLNYTQILDDYLESGKNCIINCASFDSESSTSKRRQPVASPGQRRTKRRRKFFNWGGADSHCDAFGDDDFRSTTAVDHFAQRINLNSRWYLSNLAAMLRALSHHVVDPMVHWMCKANQLLGQSDDLVALLEESDDDLVSSKTINQGHTQDDEISGTSSPLDQQRLFPFYAIEECIKTLKDHQILSLLDESEKIHALDTKRRDVAALAKQAKSLVERVGDDSMWKAEEFYQDTDDEILCGLKHITKLVDSPEHGAHNIDPLGFAQLQVFQISRENIDDAILWRSFLLGVWRLSSLRERKQFIEDLATSMAELPDPPGLELSDRRARAEELLQKKVKTLSAIQRVEAKYEDLITKTQTDEGLMSTYRVEVALQELRSLPVLVPVEEKLSLRLGYIRWTQRAAESLPIHGSSISFPLLASLYESLDLILKGKAAERAQLIANLKTSEKVETAVKAFIDEDADFIDPYRREAVVRLFRVSSSWKDRAEAIISSLRMHGNAAAGEAIPCVKLPSLVDIKRVSDLVAEYKALMVDVPGYMPILQKVLKNAAQWSSRLEMNLLRDQYIMESAKVLAIESRCRPKGLIMDPTRQALEMVAELLDWHYRSRETWKGVLAQLQTANGMSRKEAVGELIHTEVYPLLAEGLEVVECYSRYSGDKHEVSSILSSRMLEHLNIRRTAKALSRERLNAHPFGEQLFKRIITKADDKVEGSPLCLLAWADWHLRVSTFVGSVGATPDGSAPPTLTQALLYRSDEPGEFESDGASPVCLLRRFESTEKAQLEKVIKDAQSAEFTSRSLFSRSRELRKGCTEKSESIRVHLADLKDILTDIKERAAGRYGLALDPMLEPQVEHHVKIFSWLVRWKSLLSFLRVCV